MVNNLPDSAPIDSFDKLYPITKNSNDGGVTYTIFVYDVIEEITEFSEVLSTLDNAVEGDTVVFKINSPGGYLHSMISIIDAIRATKAQTIAECSGTIASAATMLALACDGLYIAKHSTFMLHNFTGGVYGKGHEIVADVEHMVPNNKKIVIEFYKKFITKKEIKKLLGGTDYYFTAEEVRRRWDNVIEHRQSVIDKATQNLEDIKVQESIAYLSEKGYSVVAGMEGSDIT